jgi:hypothetical protein
VARAVSQLAISHFIHSSSVRQQEAYNNTCQDGRCDECRNGDEANNPLRCSADEFMAPQSEVNQKGVDTDKDNDELK